MTLIACCPGRHTGRHAMYCRRYVGPLTHRWVKTGVNGTFGGIDYYCQCGGWFRQGGLASHGDVPVCPDVNQTHRQPRDEETPAP